MDKKLLNALIAMTPLDQSATCTLKSVPDPETGKPPYVMAVPEGTAMQFGSIMRRHASLQSFMSAKTNEDRLLAVTSAGDEAVLDVISISQNEGGNVAFKNWIAKWSESDRLTYVATWFENTFKGDPESFFALVARIVQSVFGNSPNTTTQEPDPFENKSGAEQSATQETLSSSSSSGPTSSQETDTTDGTSPSLV